MTDRNSTDLPESASDRIEQLRARVAALGHRLVMAPGLLETDGVTEYAGLHILNPRTDELVIMSAGSAKHDAREVAGWCAEREKRAPNDDALDPADRATFDAEIAEQHPDATPIERRLLRALKSCLGMHPDQERDIVAALTRELAGSDDKPDRKPSLGQAGDALDEASTLVQAIFCGTDDKAEILLQGPEVRTLCNLIHSNLEQARKALD